MNHCKPWLVLALASSLAACATLPTPDTVFLSRPFKLELAQVPPAMPDAVRDVVADKRKPDDPQVAQDAERALANAEAQAQHEIGDAFAALPGVRVDATPLQLPAELAGFPVAHRNAPLSEEALQSLRSQTDADALLRFGISDYGITPHAWHSAYVGFEVVSTLGIGAFLYFTTTPTVAGAYLLEESTEETLEAYTGFHAVNKVYRPVRVEAEMIDLHTGRRVWAGRATGFAPAHFSRLYKHVSAEERDTQLQAALQKAIDRIVANFRRSAHRDEPRPSR